MEIKIKFDAATRKDTGLDLIVYDAQGNVLASTTKYVDVMLAPREA